MAQHKFENSHTVVNKRWNRTGLRSLLVVCMLPFLLSSCQPVAAGFAGVSYGIFMLIAIMTMGAFGMRLETNKSIYIKPINEQPIINRTTK